jgi:hypothetical protein
VGIRVRLLEAELRVERRYAAQADARVRELQSHLREALTQSAENRETAEKLQHALTTAEECRAAVEIETARRERELADLLNVCADPAWRVNP